MLKGRIRLLGLVGAVLLFSSAALASDFDWGHDWNRDHHKHKPVQMPEPSVLVLTGVGAAGLIGAIRRKTR